MYRKPTLWLALVLALIGCAYGNSFQNGFHFDDVHTIVDNPSIRSLHNLPRFFTDAATFSVLPANRTYRPMVSTSLALDYALAHGYQPFWFHVSTFLLFLAQVAILYALYALLFNKLGQSHGNRWIALFAAAWYGLHPVMAETVNYIIQRGDLFCTLGCVAALYLFARYPGRRREGIYLLPLAFALLSKPPAAIFPVLLFLYVFFFEEDPRRIRTSLLAALPSFAVTALLLWVQSAMTPHTFQPSILSPWDYRLTQPFVWLRYFGAFFLPLHLNVDTDLAPITSFDLRAFAGLLFLALLTLAIWLTSRRRTLYPIAFGLSWFVLTQLPTSLYPLSEVENDHRMFFSFVGLALAVSWAGALLLRNAASWNAYPSLPPAVAAAAVVLLSAYAYGTHIRNAVWHDEESLWRDDIAKSPHNGRGLMIFGLTQMNKGAYPAALNYFQQALLYTPNYATLEINLAIVNGAMADQGDRTHALEVEPHFQRALALTPTDDLPHAFYGRWLKDHNRTQEAIDQLNLAVQLNPSRPMQRELLLAATTPVPTAQPVATLTRNAADWINLSLAQYQQAKYQQAIDSARQALRLDPSSAEAYNNIGAAYGAMHQWDEEIQAVRHAIALNANLQLARNNLAWALSQKHLELAKQPLPKRPAAVSRVDETRKLAEPRS